MKNIAKKFVVIVVLISLMMVVVPSQAQPLEVWVDDDGPDNGHDHFNTIQEGIDAVAIGGTVHVAAGTYAENVLINKSIDLLGKDKDTTVLEPGNGKGFYVTVDSVTITGFTIQNCKSKAVQLRNNEDCTISDNIITHSSYPIHLSSASNITISDNIISHNGPGGSAVWCTGTSNNNIIIGNTMSYNDGGVWIYGGHNYVISDNSIYHSKITGISFMFGSNNHTVSRNEISYNTDGISTSWGGSKNNTITENTIKYNTDDGIDIQNTDDTNNEIHHNYIYENADYGVHSQAFVDATHNWWGDTNGPSGGVTDPITGMKADGAGDRISVNVHFYPWTETPPPHLREEEVSTVYPPIERIFDITIAHVASGGTYAVQDGKRIGTLSLEEGTHTLEIGVSNTGILTAHDVILTIETPEGMSIDVSPKSTDIERLSVEAFTITLKISDTIEDGEYTLTLNAEAPFAHDTLLLTIYVE